MKKILMAIALFILVGCGNKTVPILHEESYMVEYGADFTVQLEEILNLYEEYTSEDEIAEELKTSLIEEIDTMIVGEKEYVLTIKETEMTLTIIVEDTKLPTLEGETSFTVVQGSTIDYKKMVGTDEVDGELEVTYDGEVDFNVVGEQKVVAKTEDKNGNEVTKEITITITEKPKVEAPKTNPTTPPANNNNSNPSPSTPTPPASNNNGGATITPEQDTVVMTGKVEYYQGVSGKWQVAVQWESQRIGKFYVSVYTNGGVAYDLACESTIEDHPDIMTKSVEVAMPYFNQ